MINPISPITPINKRIGPIRPIGPSENNKALIMQCRAPSFCFGTDGTDRSNGIDFDDASKPVGTGTFGASSIRGQALPRPPRHLRVLRVRHLPHAEGAERAETIVSTDFTDDVSYRVSSKQSNIQNIRAIQMYMDSE